MVAAFFLPVAVDLEEHCSSRLAEPEITDFVNDEGPWLGEHFHGVRRLILSEGSTETCQTDRKKRRCASSAVRMPRPGGDVSLPIPRQAVTHCSEWPKIRWFLDDFLCGAF